MQISFGTRIKLCNYTPSNIEYSNYNKKTLNEMFKTIVPAGYMDSFEDTITQLNEYCVNDGKNATITIGNRSDNFSFVNSNGNGICMRTGYLLEYIQSGTLIGELKSIVKNAIR